MQMDKGCEFVLDLGVHYSVGQDADQEVGLAPASEVTPGQTPGEDLTYITDPNMQATTFVFLGLTLTCMSVSHMNTEPPVLE